jgi:excisionase family DNA binding protein
MSQQFDPSSWVTTAEAAEITGYSLGNIRQRIYSGALSGVKRGNTWWVRLDEVREYADKLKVLPGKPILFFGVDYSPPRPDGLRCRCSA